MLLTMVMIIVIIMVITIILIMVIIVVIIMVLIMVTGGGCPSEPGSRASCLLSPLLGGQSGEQ